MTMKIFFIVGIVLNVVLTGLALYWLWQNRVRKNKTTESGPGSGNAGAESPRERE